MPGDSHTQMLQINVLSSARRENSDTRAFPHRKDAEVGERSVRMNLFTIEEFGYDYSPKAHPQTSRTYLDKLQKHYRYIFGIWKRSTSEAFRIKS
jgi:hypothetical protein